MSEILISDKETEVAREIKLPDSCHINGSEIMSFGSENNGV
jgi:hypothetical protein